MFIIIKIKLRVELEVRMSTEANTEKIDVKKLLGNPKITFVLGKYFSTVEIV